MKRFKRMISLMTALVMVSAFLIVPVNAATTVIPKNAGTTNPIDMPATTAWNTTVADLKGDVASPAVSNFKLDLANESLTWIDVEIDNDSSLNFKIAGWAIDDSWKVGAPTDKDITKLFDKGGVLQLASSMDGKKPHEGKEGTPATYKTKSAHTDGAATVAACDTCTSMGTLGAGTTAIPAADNPGSPRGPVHTAHYDQDKAAVPPVLAALIVTFPAAEKRQTAPKLVVNYAIGAKATAPTLAGSGADGTWTLLEKGADTKDDDLLGKILIAPIVNKKVGTYEPFTVAGEDVPIIGEGNKIGGKVAYSIQYKANKDGENKYWPASKPSKISVSALSKAPNLKPDYKNGIIKPKAGFATKIDGGAVTFWGKTTDAINASVVPILLPAKGDGADDLNSNNTKIGLPAGGTVGSEKEIVVFAYATAKKPASLPLTIKVAPAAAKPTDIKLLGAKQGDAKLKLDKTLQSRLTADDKWAKAKVVAGTTTTFEVRVKATAKADKVKIASNGTATMGYTGLLASPKADATLAWGVNDKDKPILSAAPTLT